MLIKFSTYKSTYLLPSVKANYLSVHTNPAKIQYSHSFNSEEHFGSTIYKNRSKISFFCTDTFTRCSLDLAVMCTQLYAEKNARFVAS